MKTILISGGNGKLAKAIIQQGKDKFFFIAPPHNDMDITKQIDIDKYFLYKDKPDYFIHAAALTRPLAQHDKDPVLSINTNIIGTANIVKTCIRYNIKLIYISTDYVYPGVNGNYKETDPVLPFTNYGWSKLGGECAVQIHKNSLIIRLCLCNKPFPHTKAFTNVIKNYIYEEEAAKIILQLLDETGIINVGGTAQSVFDFAKQDNIDIKPTTSTQNINTSLNIEKLWYKLKIGDI